MPDYQSYDARVLDFDINLLENLDDTFLQQMHNIDYGFCSCNYSVISLLNNVMLFTKPMVGSTSIRSSKEGLPTEFTWLSVRNQERRASLWVPNAGYERPKGVRRPRDVRVRSVYEGEREGFTELLVLVERATDRVTQRVEQAVSGKRLRYPHCLPFLGSLVPEVRLDHV